MKKGLNTVGFIAALLMFTTVIMKINHLPGAGISLVLAGLAVSIYLPFLLLYTPGEESSAKANRIGWLGALSASVITLAIMFKFQHWPGAGILLVLGLTAFALVFVPLLLRKKMQADNSVRRTIMNVLGASGLTLFSLGILFKVQHWPGASLMVGSSVLFLFFGYFLLYLTDRSIDPVAKMRYLRKAFVSVMIGCVITSLLLVALNKPVSSAPAQQELASAEHR